MKPNDKKIQKAQVSSSVAGIIKKLKRVRSHAILFDMREHVRSIDKNIVDLLNLRLDLERDE